MGNFFISAKFYLEKKYSLKNWKWYLKFDLRWKQMEMETFFQNQKSYGGGVVVGLMKYGYG